MVAILVIVWDWDMEAIHSTITDMEAIHSIIMDTEAIHSTSGRGSIMMISNQFMTIEKNKAKNK